MQPLTAEPRETLTGDAVTALIRDTAAVTVSAGCELLDMSLNVLRDLTDVFAGGTVGRESYATLHGGADLDLEAALDWGTAILRPYLVMRSPATTARFNLGAYFTLRPAQASVDRAVWAVQCVDILDALNDPVGEAYSIPAGTSYLGAVEGILADRGYTRYVIDYAETAKTLPAAQTWALDADRTWLNVVNDLLGAIGYQGVWSDWDGRLRVQPYVSPADRAPEWTYDVKLETSMFTDERQVESDLYRAPNRWVFWRANNVDGPAPVEGDGQFTFLNAADGPTSVRARGGRVITKPVPLDVADHASLLAAAQVTIDADLRLTRRMTTQAWPNPLHWHFDRVQVDDPALGPNTQAVVTKWTLYLDGSDMTQELAVL